MLKVNRYIGVDQAKLTNLNHVVTCAGAVESSSSGFSVLVMTRPGWS